MHHQSSSALLHHYHYYSIQETSNDLPTPTPPALLILPQHVPAANARRANIIFDARRSSDSTASTPSIPLTTIKSRPLRLSLSSSIASSVSSQSRRLETGNRPVTIDATAGTTCVTTASPTDRRSIVFQIPPSHICRRRGRGCRDRQSISADRIRRPSSPSFCRQIAAIREHVVHICVFPLTLLIRRKFV